MAAAAFVATRVIGLDRYPVSFLADEAVQMVDAANLWHAGLRDPDGMLLPAHLPNGEFLNLGTTIYMQLAAYAVAGYSVVAARAVVVLCASSAAVIAALTLRDVYRVRAWWSVVLLLSVTPAWFLHTRTALETGVAASFWCWFICLYLRFRAGGSVRFLYGSVAAAALAFYAYSPMQVVVPVTAALFVLFDVHFVKAHADALLRAAALAALLALPELRFQLAHGGETTQHLHALGSYWTDPDLGVADKTWRFARTYAGSLDPRYWYLPGESHDLSRHVMRGYGHMLAVTAPLTLLGLGIAVRRITDARYRLLLLAAFAAPVGAATVDHGITRVLPLVIPAALFAALGLAALLQHLARRAYAIAAVAIAAVLFATNVAMLRDALANGGTWYRDYGLYGIQFGGREVTHAIDDHLQSSPKDRVVLSPNWANGADTLVSFFLPHESRVRTGSIDLVLGSLQPDPKSMVFVVPPEEYDLARRSPKLGEVRVLRVVSAPDGEPAFYFIRVGYAPGAAALIARDQAALRRQVTERLVIDGLRATVTHPLLDRGSAADLFDGDTLSLARTADAYPMTVRVVFARPRPLRVVRVRGAADGRELGLGAGGRTWTDGAPDGTGVFEVILGAAPLRIREFTIRFRDTPGESPSHVHVAEIELD